MLDRPFLNGQTENCSRVVGFDSFSVTMMLTMLRQIVVAAAVKSNRKIVCHFETVSSVRGFSETLATNWSDRLPMAHVVDVAAAVVVTFSISLVFRVVDSFCSVLRPVP